MKTSLIIEDSLFKAAKREAEKMGKTISETISLWARVGRETLLKRKKIQTSLKTVNLGGPAKIDLSSRRDWMDELEK